MFDIKFIAFLICICILSAILFYLFNDIKRKNAVIAEKDAYIERLYTKYRESLAVDPGVYCVEPGPDFDIDAVFKAAETASKKTLKGATEQ